MSKNRNEVLAIMAGAVLNKDANVNFADTNAAVQNALCDLYGVTPDMDYRAVKRAVNNDFSIIEEWVDEVLPKQLENIMGAYATILNFGRDEEVVYHMKNLGHRRAMLAFRPGARSGMYESYRIDGKNLTIGTKTYTAGTSVSLEDILLGRLTLGEMMADILQGIQYQIYRDIVKAMRTIKTEAPAANVAASAGFDVTRVDNLIHIASAYGTPVIVCFQSFAAKVSNAMSTSLGYTPNNPVSDVDQWKAQGYIDVYKGTKLIVLPNFITDELENDEWAFKEADAFILPTGEKPVIVAMRGDSVVTSHQMPAGGEEQNLSKMMGTAVIAYNNLCVYTDTTIQTAEASDTARI